MTAYIKMIDVWMISTMMYPFSAVSLYSVLEFLKDENLSNSVTPVPDRESLGKRRKMRIIAFMLDYGLPVVFVIFTIFFWVLGLINISSPALDTSC